jgi:epoxyqueuosine reductase
MSDATHELATAVKAEALRLGFELAGIAPAVSPEGFAHLAEWLDCGFAGEMDYLPRRRDAYRHPSGVLPEVRSLVVVAMNYRTADPPAAVGPGQGRVARYAWGMADYHDVLRERLRRLARFLHERAPGCRTRIAVDTAPLLERDFARRAGLGWFGKNTLLINKRQGSWLFLGALLTDVALAPDAPHESAHCGTCTRCLEACPTDAFPAPYVLDAAKCISYLTIELRDQPIPDSLREGVGEWLFGCDVCQEVCPWNRKAPVSAEDRFQPRADLRLAECRELLTQSEEQFQERFGHTPLERPKRAGLLRNACIVLGNARDPAATAALGGALCDRDALVRGAAAWALGQIGGPEAAERLGAALLVEQDAETRHELETAMWRASQAE